MNRFRDSWYVWLFPVIALVFSGWLLLKYFEQRGLQISISFVDASAIQAGKTNLLYRGVAIGTVENILISKDNKNAIAQVTLHRDAEHFAVEGSKFWVVSPKVGFQGISGLETIFQGTYITVDPGDPDGEQKTEFRGQTNPVEAEPLENTSAYFLETSNVESVSPGDSVTFRGIKVGSVTDVSLNQTAQLGVVTINLQNKYRKLVRTNTVFWRKVGVQAKFGLFGSEVKVGSLDSIVKGGVDFFTPDKPGPIVKAGARFTLSAAPPKDWEKWNPVLK